MFLFSIFRIIKNYKKIHAYQLRETRYLRKFACDCVCKIERDGERQREVEWNTILLISFVNETVIGWFQLSCCCSPNAECKRKNSNQLNVMNDYCYFLLCCCCLVVAVCCLLLLFFLPLNVGAFDFVLFGLSNSLMHQYIEWNSSNRAQKHLK